MKACYIEDETESYNIELTAHITIEVESGSGEGVAVETARKMVTEYPLKYLNVSYIEKA